MNRCCFILFCLITRITLAQDLSNVNTRFDESNPIISPDGNTLFFIRRYDPQNIGGSKDPGDIWISKLNGDSAWSLPVNPGKPVNTPQFNGVIGYSPVESAYLVYGFYTKGSNTTTSQGISKAKYINDIWSYPEKISIQHYKNKSDQSHMSISNDGRTLLMALESYGSYGAEDLYVSFLRPDGIWSQPRNLGYQINTDKQEMSPVVSPDNRTVFFASNGYEGFGSWDIFLSKRQGETWNDWSPPENMKGNINSSGRESFGSIIGSNMFMYISTQNSDGYGDIKIIELDDNEMSSIKIENIIDQIPEITSLTGVKELKNDLKSLSIIGVVANGANQEKLEAVIKLNDQYGKPLTIVRSNHTDGSYILKIDEFGDYQIEVEKDGFLTIHEEISYQPGIGEIVEINLNIFPIEAGTKINLRHANFYRGTSELIESSYDELNLVAQMLLQNPDIEIELAGHTDNRGSARLNVELSEQRVEVVKQYLVEKGVSQKRIKGKGFGGSKPIASNATEESRKLNRRVEFIILKD